MDLFFQPEPNKTFLSAEEAKHCSKVFRYTTGDSILVTDGRGCIEEAIILSADIDKVIYKPVKKLNVQSRSYRVIIGIAPTRKAERNEWMVEKLTEIGVDEIRFFLSTHTHKESVKRVVNAERLERIAIAAMKQSKQAIKPVITLQNSLNEVIKSANVAHRFIAYVSEDIPQQHLITQAQKNQDILVLIGPEGDFSREEINLSFASGFKAVSLGKTRLRTETAAVAACHCIHLANEIS
jgi:16S rRNA (uracil1498-N3)-methyltransferase